jgi:hypothetical protein
MCLGRGAYSCTLEYVRAEAYLATHAHLVGASNFGKSYYLEHLLRSYAALGIPASLIDPHGDLAAAYWRFLASRPGARPNRNLLLLRPGDATHSVGFDPFSCGLTEPGEVASLVLESCLKVWGTATGNETPRLERILRLMFHAFAENARPLPETYQFLRVENHAYRAKLLQAVRDEKVRQSWQEIELLPKGDKLERLESSWNRLQRFLAIPAVERLFTPQARMLNFPEVFRRRQMLVADLSLLHSTEAQSLVGTMLVNAFYHAAKRRPRQVRPHWVLAVDEFPQFVTTDIARSLDEIRKFGVRLILAHQHLGQLPPELLGSVLTNAKFRVVFGGLPRTDAEILARELFTGLVTGERVKHRTIQTKFWPRIEERDTETYAESASEGETESDGWSEGAAYGGGETSGEAQSTPQEGVGVGTLTCTHATASSHAGTFGRAVNSGVSRARTRGYTRGTAFVTEHEPFREETSRQFRSLDEEWERLVARIMNLDRREALVKVMNGPVHEIVTPEIRHPNVFRRRRRRPRVAPGGAEPSPPSAGPQPDLPEDFRE